MSNQQPNPRAIELSRKIRTIKDLFEKAKPQLKDAAPRHITPDRMIKVAVASMSRVRHLAECTPETLLVSLMAATELGLEPNTPLQHGFIIPMLNRQTGRYEANFWPGWRGLIFLAFQSGEVKGIRSAIVKTVDAWTFEDRAGGATWSFKPHEDDEERLQAPTRLVYAAATLTGDREHMEYMTRAEINKIRAAAPSARGESPWNSHWEEMARKTVVKRLCKYLPLSPERVELLGRAIAHDNAVSGEVDNEVIADMAIAIPEDAPSIPAEAPPVSDAPKQLNEDTRVPVPPMGRADEIADRVATARGKQAKQAKDPVTSNSTPASVPPMREPGDDDV